MRKNQKKRKQKPREHFKVNLERIARHIGKIADNTSLKDIQEVTLNAALAYAGYETFRDWRGALVGPISLKLATTEGGTLSPSQIAGIAGLSLLGVAIAGGERFEQTYKVLTGEPVFQGVLPSEGPDGKLSCPQGYKLVVSQMAGGAACVPSGEPT